MSALGVVQMFVDIAFLFLILLLLLGRGWKRGGANTTAEEQEAYRDMISTLTVLIKEMKQSAGEMQDRLGAKQVELSQAISAADERIRKLTGMPEVRLDRMAPPSPLSPVESLPVRMPPVSEAQIPRGESGPVPVSPDSARRIAPDSTPIGQERTLEEDERDRAEKYRQVLEFADKGWSGMDIARFLQVPKGEVDLLMRTKVRKTGGS
jgi:hypothetical protein